MGFQGCALTSRVLGHASRLFGLRFKVAWFRESLRVLNSFFFGFGAFGGCESVGFWGLGVWVLVRGLFRVSIRYVLVDSTA